MATSGAGGCPAGAIVFYAGCESSFVDPEPAFLGCSYRVKLISPSNKESPGSNVVERQGGIRQIR